MMDIQDEKLDRDMQGIKALQEEVLKKDVIEHLKAVVERDVSDLIDTLVQEQVEAVLQAEHLRPELLTELRRHEQELSEVERALHNSESRRANAQIRTADLQRRLYTIRKRDGTVSLHFPENIHALLGMDGEAVKALMREYGLDKPSDSRDRNLNSLMQFLGLSYQLVRSPVLSPHPRIHHLDFCA
ncbi:hypothetical protein DAEQUDRAFT_526920 [Daedalea quercina L-15889]|uniref:Uncharacterized protein n=1 Tax=Daedalea quercina L-15889 TaxID=1314783 RepID=A0A165M9M5_9APHY|nr:hypothetical protein DAEQUDRAFT_526920 [Daedalea quercina L-15889]